MGRDADATQPPGATTGTKDQPTAHHRPGAAAPQQRDGAACGHRQPQLAGAQGPPQQPSQQQQQPHIEQQPSLGRGMTLPVSNLGPTGERYQLLRMEAASATETRRLLALLDVAFYLSLAALAAYLVLRWQAVDDDGTLYFICTTDYSVVNLALAALLLPAAFGTAAWTGYRCLAGLAAGKHWTQRRRRLFGMYAVQLASATLGMACFLASNAIVVSPLTCTAPATRRAIYWLAFVRWSCWNTTFLATTVKAHSTTIVPPAAAAAAAKHKWRRLLFLAWEGPVDLWNPHHHYHPDGGREQQQQQAQQQQQQAQQQQAHQQQAQRTKAAAGHEQAPGGTTDGPCVAVQGCLPLPAPADVEAGLAAPAGPGSRHATAAVRVRHTPGAPPAAASAGRSGGAQRDGARGGGAQGRELVPPQGSAAPQGAGLPGSRRGSKPARPDMLVLDLPWVYHWPKLLLWLAFEACHIGLAVEESLFANEHKCRALVDTCDLHSCWPGSRVVGLLSAELGVALMYYAVWVWLMLRSGRLLRSRSWQAFRVANLIFRLERRLGIWAYSLIVVASVIFWFGSLADCSRAAFQYQGLPTTELMWACISIIGMLFMQPHSPHQANPQLVVQLQAFSWTEAELQDKIRARNAAVKGCRLAAKVAAAPMFCFETAAKLFFFSSFVYADYDGARETAAGGAVGVPEVQLEQLLKALALYNLEVHKVIFDDDGELKVLFCWNAEDTLVVVFRGSTTAANWIADAMMWRSTHPGSTWANKRAALFNAPKIHAGFARCWGGTGLDRRVLGMVKALVTTSLNPGRLKIYFTGHSLGGALATLAAYDLVTACPTLDSLRQVSVYTFGAPRVGNHAFARQYQKAVPDTWHVINGQASGKFISAYKRNGQRVIVNKTGDIVVRPTPLEASMLQLALGSNPLNHLLQSYQQALTAAALGQLDELKALPGGAEGLLGLLRNCPIMSESLYRYGNQQNLIRWVGSRVWYTLASRAPREVLTARRMVSDYAIMTNNGGPPPAGGQAAATAAARRSAARQRQQQQQQQQAQEEGDERPAGMSRLARLGSSMLGRAGSSRPPAVPGQRQQQQQGLRSLDQPGAQLGPLTALGHAAGWLGGRLWTAATQVAGMLQPQQPQKLQVQPEVQQQLASPQAFSSSAESMPPLRSGAAPARHTAAAAAAAAAATAASNGSSEGQAPGAALQQRRRQQQPSPAPGDAVIDMRWQAPEGDVGAAAPRHQQPGALLPQSSTAAAHAAPHVELLMPEAQGAAPAVQLVPSSGDASSSDGSSTGRRGDATASAPAATGAAPAVDLGVPVPQPAAAAGTAMVRCGSSSSSSSSSSGPDRDPLVAAAARKLEQVQRQAAADRMGLQLPPVAPLHDVIGYLTGVMPAWPSQWQQQQQQREPAWHMLAGRAPHHGSAQPHQRQQHAGGGSAAAPQAAYDMFGDDVFYDAAEGPLPSSSGNSSGSSSGELFYSGPGGSGGAAGAAAAAAAVPAAAPASSSASSAPASQNITAVPQPRSAGGDASSSSSGMLSPFSPASSSAGLVQDERAPTSEPTAAGTAAVAASRAEALGDGGSSSGSADAGTAAVVQQLGLSGSLAAALEQLAYVDPVAPAGQAGGAANLLLDPARSAPQALFNPAAALVGVRRGDGDAAAAQERQGEGVVGHLLTKLVGGSSSGGTSGGGGGADRPSSAGSGAASRPGTPARGGGAPAGGGGPQQVSDGDGPASAAKGALGMLGLSSPGHAAAGTGADTSGDSSTSSRLRSPLHPRHRRVGSDGAGSTSSGDAAGAGGGSSDAAEHRRYLFSLDVRRLSLASPLLPGGHGQASGRAVLETRMHMPVLPEEGERA